VRCGLGAVPDRTAIVVVHDAARPLATPALFRGAIAAVAGGADAGVCGVPITDTVVEVSDGEAIATLDRDALMAVQTPQAFSASTLRRAHAGEPEATDDASIVRAAGGRVVLVAGDERNVKLTQPSDLAVVAFLAGSP
jgi:2-C-methyl-D-erythritol 4-phosphate cytidylyltransferase